MLVPTNFSKDACLELEKIDESPWRAMKSIIDLWYAQILSFGLVDAGRQTWGPEKVAVVKAALIWSNTLPTVRLG